MNLIYHITPELAESLDLPKNPFGKRSTSVTLALNDDSCPHKHGIWEYIISESGVKESVRVFDHLLTIPEALALLETEREQYAQYREHNRRKAEERLAIEIEKRELARQAKESKRLAAMSLEWQNDKAITDLYRAIVACSEVEQDSRFGQNWVMNVTGINVDSPHNMLRGEWVKPGTVEIENKPMLFLVAGTSGSHKNHYTIYRVVVLRGGKLEKTDIHTTSESAGWQLRIRNQVQTLLSDLGIR